MHHNIKATEIVLTPEIRVYVGKRLSSMDKFVSHLAAARVDVELEHTPLVDGPHYRAEATFWEPALETSLRAEARGQTLHEAIDLMMGELFGDITRQKRRRLDILRRGALRVKEYLRGLRDR